MMGRECGMTGKLACDESTSVFVPDANWSVSEEALDICTKVYWDVMRAGPLFGGSVWMDNDE